MTSLGYRIDVGGVQVGLRVHGLTKAREHAVRQSKKYPTDRVVIWENFKMKAGKKYVAVYLNGHLLPKSAWRKR